MQSFDQSLQQLVADGRVDFATARAAASNAADFELGSGILAGSTVSGLTV